MCDVHVYLLKNGQEEKILESVEYVKAEGEDFILRNIFGQEKKVKASFKLLDNDNNKLLLKAV
jgi:predicted RNA-binding protein